VYIDPPGSPAAQQARINNLDLKVTSPSGIVYWGNHGMVATAISGAGQHAGENFSLPGGGPNDYDTVENVFLQNPEPGMWNAHVIAAQVVQDAVPSVPGTRASFALAVTGGVAGPPPALRMSSAGLPRLIAPDQGHEVRVTIEPLGQGLLPGSAMVHFRAEDGAPFTSLALSAIGSDEFAAVLPGFACGSEPQLYFSAQGDQGEMVFLPRNAPLAVYPSTSGVIVTEPLLTATFTAGLPAGWSADGLWHTTSACAPAGNIVEGCHQGPHAYYGRAGTCNYNLPTGTNSGSLNAPAIALPDVDPDGGVMLSFCYALETEQHPSLDKAELLVNGQTRPEWRLPDVAPTPEEPDRRWASVQFDLTEFAGQTVTLSWRFDTVTQFNNAFRGWHLNDVRILVSTIGCEPRACYANCDGNSIDPVLNVEDFTCFINEFASGLTLQPEQQIEHYANCDGSTTVPVLNVEDFICFINAFAAGCP
jgi:hypothetical protein